MALLKRQIVRELKAYSDGVKITLRVVVRATGSLSPSMKTVIRDSLMSSVTANTVNKKCNARSYAAHSTSCIP